MLLTITAPPLRASQPGASAHFDATGGTVGRASTNMLVLDDPERTVSRVHAQIVFREGRFFVVDRGSNPMSHNGRPLGAGGAVGGVRMKEYPAQLLSCSASGALKVCRWMILPSF